VAICLIAITDTDAMGVKTVFRRMLENGLVVDGHHLTFDNVYIDKPNR
jgi:hypothetical protein